MYIWDDTSQYSSLIFTDINMLNPAGQIYQEAEGMRLCRLIYREEGSEEKYVIESIYEINKPEPVLNTIKVEYW